MRIFHVLVGTIILFEKIILYWTWKEYFILVINDLIQPLLLKNPQSSVAVKRK